MKAKKKTTMSIIAVIILSIFILIYYGSIRTVRDHVGDFDQTHLTGIDMRLYFGWKSQNFLVENEDAIGEMIALIGEVKVIPVLFKPESRAFNGNHKNFYMISFIKDNEDTSPSLFITVAEKELSINGKYYRIVGESGLDKLYEITIRSQDPSKIDPYYIDLIDQE